jgi:hypothetical protein
LTPPPATSFPSPSFHPRHLRRSTLVSSRTLHCSGRYVAERPPGLSFRGDCRPQQRRRAVRTLFEPRRLRLRIQRPQTLLQTINVGHNAAQPTFPAPAPSPPLARTARPGRPPLFCSPGAIHTPPNGPRYQWCVLEYPSGYVHYWGRMDGHGESSSSMTRSLLNVVFRVCSTTRSQTLGLVQALHNHGPAPFQPLPLLSFSELPRWASANPLPLWPSRTRPPVKPLG